MVQSSRLSIFVHAHNNIKFFNFSKSLLRRINSPFKYSFFVHSRNVDSQNMFIFFTLFVDKLYSISYLYPQVSTILKLV